MKVRQLSPKLLKVAQDELGEVPSKNSFYVEEIKNWLGTQKYINANLDDQWILSFLRFCKFDLMETKRVMESYYTNKFLIPELMVADDPRSESFRQWFKKGFFIPLMKPVTEDGCYAFLLKPGLAPAETFNPMELSKNIFMIFEYFAMENDNFSTSGAIIIQDQKDVTMAHCSTFTPLMAKKMNLVTESFPLNLKKLVWLNAPSFINSVFNYLGKFYSPKLMSKFEIEGDYQKLYKMIPKELLPTEYGGTAGPLNTFIDYWDKKFTAYADYFVKAKNYKTDESKRPGGPKAAIDLTEEEKSFRILTID